MHKQLRRHSAEHLLFIMDNMDSDVEFDDEWEEVQAPAAATAAAAADDEGDIVIHLYGEPAMDLRVAL